MLYVSNKNSLREIVGQRRRRAQAQEEFMNLDLKEAWWLNFMRPFNNGKLDRGKNTPMRNFREMVTRKK